MAKTKAKTKKSKAPKTAVFIDKYKGKATFSIWNVDDDGDKVGDYPVIAFGLTKAKALIEHLEALEEYVDNEGEASKKSKSKAKRKSSDSEEDFDAVELSDKVLKKFVVKYPTVGNNRDHVFGAVLEDLADASLLGPDDEGDLSKSCAKRLKEIIKAHFLEGKKAKRKSSDSDEDE